MIERTKEFPDALSRIKEREREREKRRRRRRRKRRDWIEG